MSSKIRRHKLAIEVDDVFFKRRQSLEADCPDAPDLEPVRVPIGERFGVRRRSAGVAHRWHLASVMVGRNLRGPTHLGFVKLDSMAVQPTTIFIVPNGAPNRLDPLNHQDHPDK